MLNYHICQNIAILGARVRDLYTVTQATFTITAIQTLSTTQILDTNFSNYFITQIKIM